MKKEDIVFGKDVGVVMDKVFFIIYFILLIVNNVFFIGVMVV